MSAVTVNPYPANPPADQHSMWFTPFFDQGPQLSNVNRVQAPGTDGMENLQQVSAHRHACGLGH